MSSAAILAQDFLGICLLLAKGDTSLSLLEVAIAAEKFQETRDRHFGDSRQEFRLMLWMLLRKKDREPTHSDYAEYGMFREALSGYTLSNVIHDMLNHFEVLSFERDTDWVPFYEPVSEEDFIMINAWFQYDEAAYRKKHEVRQAMLDFFSTSNERSPAHVRSFLAAQGVDDALLIHCSRPGA